MISNWFFFVEMDHLGLVEVKNHIITPGWKKSHFLFISHHGGLCTTDEAKQENGDPVVVHWKKQKRNFIVT